MAHPHISVRGLAHAYGSNGGTTVALESVDLRVERGEFVSVVGPSGGGKTTLLRCIGGLIDPDAGRIEVGGRPADRRSGDIGYVFQDPSLLPWRTVSGNVALPLEIGGGRADPGKVAETLDAVGLAGFGGHYPHQLSGGMAQRTAFARALAMDPDVLLMDEPLGALDAFTRETMQELILDVWRKTGKVVFFITHSVDEALFMATRLVVMSPRPGRITHRYDLDFCRRFFETGDARAIKASREFVRLREEVLSIIHGAGMLDQP